MGGSGGKVVAALPCPSCQEPVTVYRRQTAGGPALPQPKLWFTCIKCNLRLSFSADDQGCRQTHHSSRTTGEN